MSDAYEQAAIEDEVEVNANPIAAPAPCLPGVARSHAGCAGGADQQPLLAALHQQYEV